MTVVYVPVADDEVVQNARALWQGKTDKAQAEGRTARIRLIVCTDSGLAKAARRRRGEGLLREVGAADKLYVMAHSFWAEDDDPDGETFAGIGGDRGGRTRLYDPEILARHLRAEGLTRQFVDLRMFACNSGLAQASLGGLTFAGELARELRALGYASILVTGYLGEVKGGYAQRRFAPNHAGIRKDTNTPWNTATLHKGVKLPDGHWGVASLHRTRF